MLRQKPKSVWTKEVTGTFSTNVTVVHPISSKASRLRLVLNHEWKTYNEIEAEAEKLGITCHPSLLEILVGRGEAVKRRRKRHGKDFTNYSTRHYHHISEYKLVTQ